MTSKTKWIIDSAHSEIDFEVKHVIITNVKGTFKKFNATVYTVNSDFLSAEIYFTIKTSSIDTGNIYIDEHLKSADFFDVENHKQLDFKGYIDKNQQSNGNYELSGNLTIKGITKPVTLAVEFGGIKNHRFGTEIANFKIKGAINRNDWGLNWNTVLEAGKITVSNEVQILCDIQLKQGSKQDFEAPAELLRDLQTTTDFVQQ